jgi:hypothetical protein
MTVSTDRNIAFIHSGRENPMTLRIRTIFLAGVLSLSAFPQPTPAPVSACAVAQPRGGFVAIADETAIIVWDAAAKTEHFIRRASFQTAIKDFGFIVPTPSKPTLSEVDNKAFSELALVTAPKIVTRSQPTSTGGCGCSDNRAGFVGSPAPAGMAVQVLDEVRVAGYDAVVLEADNAEALSKWLTEHGYEFSPALKEWAESYIKKGWKFTAFKIAKATADQPAVSMAAVKMTFTTDRPFYPYREPANPALAKNPPPRLLRVYFLGDKIVDGTIGTGKDPWPATVPWCNVVNSAVRETMCRQLKLPESPATQSWSLTEFEDRSSPRPAVDDVYFGDSENQRPRERPPAIHYVSNNLSGGIMFAAVGLYLAAPCLWQRIRRKRI